MSSPPRAPTLNQVIEYTVRELLAGVHTSMPGEVQSFDAAKQTCSVQPLLPVPLELEDGSVKWERLPVLTNVRVGFAGGGGFRLTFPLQRGDQVAIFFAEASIDQWQTLGGFQSPASSRRRHHLADAFVLPALEVYTGGSSSAATLGKDGGPQVVFRTGAIEIGGDASSPATEAAVLGTTYTTNEGTMLDQVSSALASMATKLTVIGASLITAAGLNAAPMIGGALAAAAFVLAGTQITALATDVGQLITAIATFRAQAAQHTSTIVKVK